MTTKLSLSESLSRDIFRGKDFFWANIKHVGYGYANLATDVRLIQFFLNAYNDSVGAGLDPLVTDGKFGGQTWARIKWYQKMAAGFAVVDGAVSPADGVRYCGPKTGKVYTIYQLNIDYLYLRGQYYDDIRRDPLLPVELCNHFSVPDFSSMSSMSSQNNSKQIGLASF